MQKKKPNERKKKAGLEMMKSLRFKIDYSHDLVNALCARDGTTIYRIPGG